MYQTKRLLRLLRQLDSLLRLGDKARPKDFHRVLTETCKYLTDALNDSTFRRDVEIHLRAIRPGTLGSADFERFLALEREVLIEFGLSDDSVSRALYDFRAAGPSTGTPPNPAGFLSMLEEFRDAVCLRSRAQSYSRAPGFLRGIGHTAVALGGLGAVAANWAIATHVDGGFLSGISVERGLKAAYTHGRSARDAFRDDRQE